MSHPFLFIALCVAALAVANAGSFDVKVNQDKITVTPKAEGISSSSPWTSVPNMLSSFSGRASFYAAGVNGKVYAMGGDGQEIAGGGPRRDIVIYDSATKEWSHGPDMINALQTSLTTTVSVVGDNIYLIHPDLGMVYNTSATQYPYWRPLPQMSVCDRVFFSTVAVGTKIYSIGGSDREGDKLYSSIDVYNTITKKFQLGPKMPEARYGVTVAAVSTKIYIMGGMNQTFFPDTERQGRKAVLKSVMVYDTATDTWSTAPDMLLQQTGGRAAAVGGKVYLIGGDHHESGTNTVQIFDPATNQWTMGPDELHKRERFGVAVLDSNIYALGGWFDPIPGSRPGESTLVEFLDTSKLGVNQAVFPLRA